MKTQEQIQTEIDRLNKSNLDFNDKLKVTKGIVNREIIRHEIRKNERKIKILEWVLVELVKNFSTSIIQE